MGKLAGEGLLVIEWTLIGIAFCLILARLYLRIFHLKSGFVLSDAFIAVAFAAGVSLNAVDVTLYQRGIYASSVDFRMTTWVASEEDSVRVYRALYFLYFPFYIEQYCNKGTLLALYYEIFGNGSAKIRISLACIVLYCIAGFITTICIILFLCRWGCYWSYSQSCPLRCWEVSDNLGWAFHFTSDILIFILPLVCISRLNMSKAQKISAGVTFCIGLINIFITIARWFVVQAVFTPVPALNTGEAMAVSDGHIGLIVSILPSLRPYLRIWQKQAGSRGWKIGSPFEGRSKDVTLSTSQVMSTAGTSSSKAEYKDRA
ncbi:hypothetical protein CGRA01v4_05932 [Colletotrichum graminicola]|uniref:Rhodopsin domain-containing protein n=1 Tax=Colletotrichum graminicola (strain M1.001 / M2 / FGSC 10212) TaxID=645133 RepID=E3QNL2_COLGM|nr:uncharacterized protein GLRG_07769 [Colletotrichum graminicola M1.001]EFQ32499.1 hypothetical protein GLRG_07769 [Colletotrichum graminicola M1.001]WDK14651.1 hypothetical protein CGRA01v4_05932 [Colletotrichum graminicola]